jgi:hypothetical protein
MDRNHGRAKNLGDLIAASYDFGSAIAPNATTAAELVTRHVARVLARGANPRLGVALAVLGRDLRPRRAPVTLPRRAAWVYASAGRSRSSSSTAVS